jgi:hypothetical protein
MPLPLPLSRIFQILPVMGGETAVLQNLTTYFAWLDGLGVFQRRMQGRLRAPSSFHALLILHMHPMTYRCILQANCPCYRSVMEATMQEVYSRVHKEAAEVPSARSDLLRYDNCFAQSTPALLPIYLKVC